MAAKGPRNWKEALAIIALALLILGLIKVMFPLIILGLVVYCIYCVVRGPKE